MSYRNRTDLVHSWGLVDRPQMTAKWVARVICLMLKPDSFAIWSQAARERSSSAQVVHHFGALLKTPRNIPGRYAGCVCDGVMRGGPSFKYQRWSRALGFTKTVPVPCSPRTRQYPSATQLRPWHV